MTAVLLHDRDCGFCTPSSHRAHRSHLSPVGWVRSPVLTPALGLTAATVYDGVAARRHQLSRGPSAGRVDAP